MLKEMSHLWGEDLSEDGSSVEGEEDVGSVSGKLKDLSLENQPSLPRGGAHVWTTTRSRRWRS